MAGDASGMGCSMGGGGWRLEVAGCVATFLMKRGEAERREREMETL